MNIIWSGIIVQFLMPLLIEMSTMLLDMMSMHDVQYFIPHLLSIARCFTNHSHHLSQKISRAEELLLSLLL